MKFLLIICLLLGGCSSPKMKSEILHGKICPFCFADNPVWRKNYCPDCFRVDTGKDTHYDFVMINLQLQEHIDHEFGAQYDDVRERYASELRDIIMDEESEREHYEYLWKVKEAGFGDDCEAYEANLRKSMSLD